MEINKSDSNHSCCWPVDGGFTYQLIITVKVNIIGIIWNKWLILHRGFFKDSNIWIEFLKKRSMAAGEREER